MLLPPHSKLRKKNLKTQCFSEKYRETEQFLAQAREKIANQEQQETLTQWFETDLRDAFAREARCIVEEFYNNRQLIPDDTAPLPGEAVHNNRPIPVQTLFGTITLKRRYFHHANSHSGRAPLDLRVPAITPKKTDSI